MTTSLGKLLVLAALVCSAGTACDKAQITSGTGGQTVELTQHGNITCVLIDSRVFCAQSKMRASMRLASSTAI